MNWRLIVASSISAARSRPQEYSGDSLMFVYRLQA